MSMKYVAFFLLTVILCSCADINRSKQVATIDQLIDSLKKENDLISPSNFDSLTFITNTINNTQQTIKQFLRDDTLSLKNAIHIDEVKQVHHQLESIKANLPVLNQEIKTYSSSLQKLKHDINNASGKRNAYQEYITTETENTASITSKVDSCVQLYRSSLEQFNKVHPELLHYIDELTLKNKDQLLIESK